jgi:hypothetical protein
MLQWQPLHALYCRVNDFKAVMLLRQPELLFTVGLKDLKVVTIDKTNILLIKYKELMDILNR